MFKAKPLWGGSPKAPAVVSYRLMNSPAARAISQLFCLCAGKAEKIPNPFSVGRRAMFCGCGSRGRFTGSKRPRRSSAHGHVGGSCCLEKGRDAELFFMTGQAASRFPLPGRCATANSCKRADGLIFRCRFVEGSAFPNLPRPAFGDAA